MGLKEKLESLSNSQVYKLWNLWIYQNIAESESPSESEMIVELSDAVADDMIAMSELLADIDNINKPKPIEDQCPKCGSNDLWHGDKTWHGEQFEQETTCNACQFEFQQWYTIAFDVMTTIAAGEHIDIVAAGTPVMKRFEFAITLAGQGNCADGAWVDAINSFEADPGIPDAEQIKVFEI